MNFGKLLLVVISISIVLMPVTLNAQEDSVVPENNTEVQTKDQDLNVELSYGEQSPGSKEFDLIATIESNIDSDRVIVEWELPWMLEFVDETQGDSETTRISMGSTQTVTARVRPYSKGSYTIKTTVTAVKADVNYTTSDTFEMSFNEDNEVLPLTDQYKQEKMLRQIGILLIFLLIVVASAGGGIWLYGRYRKATSD